MPDICPRCKQDLSQAVRLFGKDEVYTMHRHAHDREDLLAAQEALKDLVETIKLSYGTGDGDKIDVVALRDELRIAYYRAQEVLRGQLHSERQN